LEPWLLAIFEASGGVVLPTIVDEALKPRPDLAAARARVDSAMDGIFTGQTAARGAVAPVAMEALCYVFKISESDVTPLWARLCGYEANVHTMASITACSGFAASIFSFIMRS
jgi:hypothetical protein